MTLNRPSRKTSLGIPHLFALFEDAKSLSPSMADYNIYQVHFMVREKIVVNELRPKPKERQTTVVCTVAQTNSYELL